MTIWPGFGNSHRPPARQARISVALIVVMFALAVGVGATCYFFSLRSTPRPTVSHLNSTTDELDAAEAAAQAQAQQTVLPRPAVSVRHPVGSSQLSPEGSQDNPSPEELRQASAEALEAVSRLSQLDPTTKALTPEQSAAVRADFKRLVEQGTNSVPAIRQFLRQNKDLGLDDVKGGSTVGYSSLRAGMFDALRQIGGPEAESALAEVLRATGDPAEVGMLARQLEELAPGQHREEAINAARETLAQIADNKTKVDVGPLFKVLQTYGGASEVSDLQKAVPQYQYYGLMALAGLPEGQGIAALVSEARPSGPADSAKAAFALQMLAQVAPQYPEATAALIEQAKAGQIPDRAWRRIAEALAGDQYQFARDPSMDPSQTLRVPGAKVYHIGSTDENFYSIPGKSSASEADLAQRQALVDQLLNAASSSAAAETLQRVKHQLAGTSP